MNELQLRKNLDLIDNKKCKVGIIGLGYVGLPLSVLLVKNNFKIIGFDIDIKKIKNIKNNKSYIERIPDNDVKLINQKGNFYNTFSNINKCDVIIICVPTPLNLKNKPELGHVRATIKSIKKYLKEQQVLILESTSYPGTTEDEIISKLKIKFEIGKNFFVGFSSERIDPGVNENLIQKIPKVVSGYSNNCIKIISKFYSKSFNKIVESKSIEIAEFSKLLENIYRSVNIGFINEMKILADKMNLDIFEIIEVANTKPYGFRRFFPGPGVGGHCIPIDPNYLYWKSQKLGLPAKFIKLSAEINVLVLDFIIKKILKNLKLKKIPLIKSKILILGLSYKKNLDDIRESASIKLINSLQKKGIKYISYHDPYIENVSYIKNLNKIKNLNPKILKSYDLVVLMTDHDLFDYDLIKINSKLIIDCRGRFEAKNNVQRG